MYLIDARKATVWAAATLSFASTLPHIYTRASIVNSVRSQHKYACAGPHDNTPEFTSSDTCTSLQEDCLGIRLPEQKSLTDIFDSIPVVNELALDNGTTRGPMPDPAPPPYGDAPAPAPEPTQPGSNGPADPGPLEENPPIPPGPIAPDFAGAPADAGTAAATAALTAIAVVLLC